ncbi:hypothetical protein [Kineococcus rubinsiae]|uniref:hypothetical protein n=1 Tax=Kineococcus rubinsiae TaxID=2609562 RepID=UPI00143105DC|nr:hypothetical protein [Kineococcus rubinsiae]NIZ92120.1 hypothetical protein [Kineococcus rubinsiae]
MSVPRSETVLETSPDVRSENRSTTAPPAFVAQLSERVLRTRTQADSAVEEGEEDLADALLSELEGLLRLAEAHDVLLPDTAAYLEQRRAPSAARPVVVDLTEPRAPQEA